MSRSLALACLLGACAPIPHRGVSQDFVARDGERLQGELACESFTIERGVTVIASNDLVVRARRRLAIAGRLLAVDRGENGEVAEAVDAPRVELCSATELAITGEVRGGRGRSFHSEILPGGSGSTLVLSAPILAVEGLVRAGDGGDGGPGCAGGTGGDVLVWEEDSAHGASFAADAGGAGGVVVGHGGAAGIHPPEEKSPRAGQEGSVRELESPR